MRRDELWNSVNSTYIKTIKPTGYDVLINGTNKYLNFDTINGSTGYGIRDNNGTIEIKSSGGSWAAIGGGGTPGGSTTQVQYNNAGAFAGDSTFYFNSTRKVIYANGMERTSAATITRDVNNYVTSIALANGRTKTITRNASNYVTSWTDGIITKTFTRDANNYITSLAVT